MLIYYIYIHLDAENGDVQVTRWKLLNDTLDVSFFLNGFWNQLLIDTWEDQDAKVLCRQLGYSNGLAVQIDHRVTSRLMQLLLMVFNCQGNEVHLKECNYTINRGIERGVRGGVRCTNGSLYERK